MLPEVTGLRFHRWHPPRVHGHDVCAGVSPICRSRHVDYHLPPSYGRGPCSPTWLLDVVGSYVTSGAAGAKPLERRDVDAQLKALEKLKDDHYHGSWDIPKDLLVPFAFTSAGNIGARGLALLRTLTHGDENEILTGATMLSTTDGLRMRYALTRISVAIQASNAAITSKWRGSHMGKGGGGGGVPAAAAAGVPGAPDRGRGRGGVLRARSLGAGGRGSSRGRRR